MKQMMERHVEPAEYKTFVERQQDARLDEKRNAADIAATLGVAVSAGLFVAAAELTLPILATVGTVAAAVTGLARLGFQLHNK